MTIEEVGTAGMVGPGLIVLCIDFNFALAGYETIIYYLVVDFPVGATE